MRLFTIPLHLLLPLHSCWLRCLQFGLLLITTVAMLLVCASKLPAQPAATELPPSQYSSTMRAAFNQPTAFPIVSSPPSPQYRPVGEWVGRLILPTEAQYQQVYQDIQETDWAWLEVTVAPPAAQNWIGKMVRLAWSSDPKVQSYVRLATRDVQFTPEVLSSVARGNIHPERLDGRTQVGPLQSLAGGRPFDDVTVVLSGTVQPEPGDFTAANAALATPTTAATLRIRREPIQETGRFYALVKFLEPVPPEPPAQLPEQCPGESPCASEFMRVQHYNPATRQFDGPTEIIRIPQQPPDWIGVFNMTTRDLATSAAGEAGWYIYGAADAAGRFTVQAMQPRLLLQLSPQQITGFRRGLRYINFENWENTPARKGTIQSVLVTPETSSAQTAGSAGWTIGERALVLHLFGGRGGTQPTAESAVLGTYTGHFSFGVAEVIRDPFTEELRWQVDYVQIYARNVEGILSGDTTWANYMGNLQRGWMGTRPVSDVLVRLDALTQDYDFGGIPLSPLDELLNDLHLMAARYRIGDGTGGATVTPATSCVQDSAQALFATIRRVQNQVNANPQILAWLQQHPDDPTSRRFQQLVRLGRDLESQLTPMGVVRPDWASNTEILTGVPSNRAFISNDQLNWRNLAAMLLSWRTALPRQVHDELSMIFLRYGGQLWFLRTNQIGGYDPDIAPIAPTLIMGEWTLPFTQIPLLSWFVQRLFGSLTIPNGSDWRLTLAALLGFAAIALPLGYSRGFLVWRPWVAPWYRQLGWLGLLLLSALLQSLLFRVLPIPYPKGWVPKLTWWGWAMIALGLQVLMYGSTRWLRPRYAPIFTHPVFLVLITLLGWSCTVVYRLTGSLWTITCVHWLVLSVWMLLLGGKSQLDEASDRVALSREPRFSSRAIP